MMQFFPESSLNGNETFIWTDIGYDATNNLLAVSGCFWACEFTVHLFSFDFPMNEGQRFVDIVKFIDGGYDTYDEFDFIKWEDGDLHIAGLNTDTGAKGTIVIRQEECMHWLAVKGQEL
jgi:hypothetical protein